MNAFQCDTNSASVALRAFFKGLRATGTELYGTDAQLCYLVMDALQIINPDEPKAKLDAEALMNDLYVIGEALCTDTDDGCYPEEEEEETDEQG